MRLLNKIHYGDLPNQTKEAYEVLCECQNQVLRDPNPLTFAAASVASDRWNRLARIEEKFYRQKSCIMWLQAGDLNTTFFHQSVQSSMSWNAIRMLKYQNGDTLTAHETYLGRQWNISNAFSRQRIQNQNIFLMLWSRIRSPSYRCSSSEAGNLVAPVTLEEIQKAIYFLPNVKYLVLTGMRRSFK